MKRYRKFESWLKDARRGARKQWEAQRYGRSVADEATDAES